MIKEAIIQLANKQDLSEEVALQVMDEIMSGKASQVQISAYLTALSMKGATTCEIVSAVKCIRTYAVKLPTHEEVVEIVGTGGDGSHSFNISTTAAIVLASAGVPIAKHGNRAASSKCGAADVLEGLGVNIDISPEKSMKMLDDIGICFLFAPRYHPVMKQVAPVRKELGIRTIFNVLGPLLNPLSAKVELMGVYDEALVEPLAKVLLSLGVKRGMVVFGTDGLDEISISAPTKVCEIRDGKYEKYEINPMDLGFGSYDKSEILGGDPEENVQITLDILKGKKGAQRDAVVINAAAALYIARQEISLKEAIYEIERVIDGGKAMEKLSQFIKYSNS